MSFRLAISVAVSLAVSFAWSAEPASPPVPAAKPLNRFEQLARTNPFRPLGMAAKAIQGEPGGATASGEQGVEAGKSPAAPAADSLAALKKSLVVTAIVSADSGTYAVIAGKRYAVGEEIAPGVKIVGIHSTGITLATAR